METALPTADEVINGHVARTFRPNVAALKRYLVSPSMPYKLAGKDMKGLVSQAPLFLRSLGAFFALVLEVGGAYMIGLALRTRIWSAEEIAVGVLLGGLLLDMPLMYRIQFSRTGRPLEKYAIHERIALESFDQKPPNKDELKRLMSAADNAVKRARRQMLFAHLGLALVAIAKIAAYGYGMLQRGKLGELSDLALIIAYCLIAALHSIATGPAIGGWLARSMMYRQYDEWLQRADAPEGASTPVPSAVAVNDGSSGSVDAEPAALLTWTLPESWGPQGESSQALHWEAVADPDYNRVKLDIQNGKASVTFPSTFVSDRDITKLVERQQDQRAAKCLLYFLVHRQLEDIGS